jgi:hypothetical protein
MISAVLLPNGTPPGVEITLSGVVPGGTLLRNALPVRTAVETSDLVLIDYDAPFGVPLTYQYGSESVITSPLVSASSWLSHPYSPALSVPVTIRNDDPITFTALGTVHRPLAGGTPFAVTAPRSGRTGSLDLITSWADRPALAALLAEGTAVLLRTPPSCRIDDGWLWCGDVEQNRAPNSANVFLSLRYERVRAPGSLPSPSLRPIQWIDVVDIWQSWALIDEPTWSALTARTIPVAGFTQ